MSKDKEGFKVPLEAIKGITKVPDAIRYINRFQNTLKPDYKVPNFSQITRMSEAIRSFAELQERSRGLANTLVDMGVISNVKVMDNYFKSAISGSHLHHLNLPLLTHLKYLDAATKWGDLPSIASKFTSMSTSISRNTLINEIFDSLGEDAFEEFDIFAEDEGLIVTENEDIYIVDDEEELQEKLEEELEVKNPLFFNAAVTINLHITMTDTKVNESGNEEEKTLWNKYIKKALVLIHTIFLAWAFSDNPIKDMNIYKAFEKVAHIIEEYEPTETTDVVSIKEEEKL